MILNRRSGVRRRRHQLGASAHGEQELALVLWDGELGGAELMYAHLAAAMRGLGEDARLVFVNYAGPLAGHLAAANVPFDVLGYERGHHVLRHPRRFAAAIACVGARGVLLPERSFLASALRLGGYAAPIVAVEHGTLLLTGTTTLQKVIQGVNTVTAAWADDVEVGVSDFIVARMRRGAHAARLQRIYNGVDPSRFTPAAAAPLKSGHELVVGFAGRLIRGKGTDDAIAAIGEACQRAALRLVIAGQGPEQQRLWSLARELNVGEQVDFRGLVSNMDQFWQECDIALFPSHQFIESFGMSALEAMACGIPVVATRNGAVPEVVIDGVTGTIVEPGDVDALADALVTYADAPELRRGHGEASRQRAAECFNIDDCARAYLRCFTLPAAADVGPRA